MNRSLCIASLVVAAAAVPRAVSAQTEGVAAARCEAAAPDTASGFVLGVLEPDSPDTKVDRERYLRILTKLAATLASDTLTLLPVTKVSEVEVTVRSKRAGRQPRLMPKWSGHPALATEVAFTVEESGALTNARILGRGDDATGVLLLRALAHVAAVPPTGRRGSARLRLRLSLSQDSTAVALPLLAARQLTLAGTPPDAVSPEISWPFAEVGRNPFAATVVVWYGIDSVGVPIAGSVGAASAADPARAVEYREFVEAVKDGVLRTRYTPGEVGGCPATWRALSVVRFNVEAPPR